MRITLSGDLGSGKSSVGRRLAERLGVPYLSTGRIFREIGRISNLDALHTNLAAEDNARIDFAVDNRILEIDRDQESFVIDSRMAWHFVSAATRVYLSVSRKTAAQRVMADTTRSGEVYGNLPAAIASLDRRRQSEVKRYRNLYDVDITDVANYDLWIMTDDADLDDLTDLILSFAQLKSAKKFWLPKARIVPTMAMGTLSRANSTPGDLPDDFQLPLHVADGFGFAFDDAGSVATAFGGRERLIPYLPQSVPAVRLDHAKRDLVPDELRRWEDAFALELSFRRCLHPATGAA